MTQTDQPVEQNTTVTRTRAAVGNTMTYELKLGDKRFTITIGIPLYLGYKSDYDKNAKHDMQGAMNVLEQCKNDNGGNYPEGLGRPTQIGFTHVTLSCGRGETVTMHLHTGTTLLYYPSPQGCTTACTGYAMFGYGAYGDHNSKKAGYHADSSHPGSITG